MRTFNEFVQYKQNAPLAEALVRSGIDYVQFCEAAVELAREINPRDPEAINELFRGLGALFGAGSRAVGRGAEAVGSKVAQGAKAVGSAIDTGISTVGQAGIEAGKALGRGAAAAGRAIDTGISTVGQAGIKAGQAVGGAIGKGAQAVGSAIDTGISTVGQAGIKAGQAVGGAVQGAAHKVADIYQSAEHQGRVKDAMGRVENMKAQLAKLGVHGPDVDAAFADFGNKLTATLEKLAANQAGRVGPGGVTHARTGQPIA